MRTAPSEGNPTPALFLKWRRRSRSLVSSAQIQRWSLPLWETVAGVWQIWALKDVWDPPRDDSLLARHESRLGGLAAGEARWTSEPPPSSIVFHTRHSSSCQPAEMITFSVNFCSLEMDKLNVAAKHNCLNMNHSHIYSFGTIRGNSLHSVGMSMNPERLRYTMVTATGSSAVCPTAVRNEQRK